MAKEDLECGFCKNVFLVDDPQPGQEIRCPKCHKLNKMPEEAVEQDMLATPAVENQVSQTTIKLVNVEVGEIYKTASKILFRVVSIEGNAVVVDLLEPCQVVLMSDKEIEVEKVSFPPLEIPVQ
jgi:phage FluMu protein Com